MDGILKDSEDTLEFVFEQKWTKGLTLRFNTQTESQKISPGPQSILKQVHGKKVLSWSPHKKDYNICEADGFYTQADSFKKSKEALFIRTADCAPLFYIDRDNQLIAALHAGWRGLQQGIHLVPFKELNFSPKSTWVWCGPCLNGDSFEVDQDMWSQFDSDTQKNFFKSSPSSSTNKRFFQTWGFLDSEFKKISLELFYNVEVDTYKNKSFASYRRWKKESSSLEKPPPLIHNLSSISFI